MKEQENITAILCYPLCQRIDRRSNLLACGLFSARYPQLVVNQYLVFNLKFKP